MATVRLHRESRTGKICLQFCNHANETARRSLPIRVDANQWNATTQRVYNHPHRDQLNITLSSLLTKAQDELLSLCTNHPSKHLTSCQVRDIVCGTIFGENSTTHTFAEVWDEFTNTKDGRTRELYELTWRQIVQSDKSIVFKSFDDIGSAWLMQFRRWCSQKQCTNTTNIRLRCIRAVFNYARKMEYTNHYPFIREHIRNTDIIHHDLTDEQLRMFMVSPVPGALLQSISVCRLMFYIIGINCKDLHTLTHDSIERGRVQYIRAKTHKAYSIKIEPEAAAIIEHFPGVRKMINMCDRYSNHRDMMKRLNRDLCSFCQHIGIPRITTNWLRHGWATFAWNNGVPMDVVSLALGHSFGLRVTQGYVAKSITNADDANRFVIDRLLYLTNDK